MAGRSSGCRTSSSRQRACSTGPGGKLGISLVSCLSSPLTVGFCPYPFFPSGTHPISSASARTAPPSPAPLAASPCPSIPGSARPLVATRDPRSVRSACSIVPSEPEGSDCCASARRRNPRPWLPAVFPTAASPPSGCPSPPDGCPCSRSPRLGESASSLLTRPIGATACRPTLGSHRDFSPRR